MTPDFLITALIVIASPGTGTLVTLAAGLSQGARASMVAALGCTLGIVPHMIAAVSGLAALLNASAAAFDMIKYAGVAYLLYMAWMTLRHDGPLQPKPDAQPRSMRQMMRHAILVNLLNPKLSVFFVAFLPQFVGADEPEPTRLMMELSFAFMGMTFAVFVGYGVLAAGIREQLLGKPAVLNGLRYAFAAAFVGLGVKLLLVQR